MKKILLIAFLFYSLHSSSQTADWVWSRHAPSSPFAAGEGWSTATDIHDNVFVAGYFTVSISFGAQTLNTPSNQASYIAKYDSAGNVKWARMGVNIGIGSSEAYNVCTDLSGNSYLTGYFQHSVSFGSYTLTSAGITDIFLVKYDSSGNVLWAKSAGGTDDDEGTAVATDRSGNVYLCGYYFSTSITAGSFVLNNSGNSDMVIAKYDSSGNVIWAKAYGGPDFDYGFSVATDASANIFMTGSYRSSSLSFGSHSITNAGSTDVFLSKIDSSGNVLWAKTAGGTLDDQAGYVSVDSSGNAYVTGGYSSSTVNFSPYSLTNSGGNDGFLARYDAAGNVVWVNNIGGIRDESGYCVATSKSYNVYVSGYFTSNAVTLGSLTLPCPASYNDPMFLAAYDSSGNISFAKVLGSGGDDNNAVAAGNSGCLYIGGDFYVVNPFIIGRDSLPLSGVEDVFIAKLCGSGITASFISSDTAFCVEPTKCIHFYDHSTGNPTSWQWLFPGGTPTSSALQSPDSICYFTPGTYPVTLVVSDGTSYDTLNVTPMIVVGSIPSPPIITVLGNDTLISSHGLSYQWLLNGSSIPGATDSSFVATATGTYSVRITGVGGCSSVSAGQYIDVNSVNDLSFSNSDVAVIPNPSRGKFSVAFNHPCSHALIKVFNVLGEEIYAEKIQGGLMKKDVELDAPSGVYFLVGVGEKYSVVEKVVVE